MKRPLLLFCLLPCLSAAPDPQRWSATAEGAAVKVKNAAKELESTAAKVREEGRIGWLPVLRSQAEELQRRAELFERLSGATPVEEEAPVPPDGKATGSPAAPTAPGSSPSAG